MKLYNLLEDIILEEKRLLTESTTKSQIIDYFNKVENGKPAHRIKMYYQGENETNPEVRYVYVLAYGLSKANNEVLRVYQSHGVTTSEIGWKLFRVDKITGWQETGLPLNLKALDNDSTIPKYNAENDGSLINIYNQIKRGPKINEPKTNEPIKPNVNPNVKPKDNFNKEKELTTTTPSRYD